MLAGGTGRLVFEPNTFLCIVTSSQRAVARYRRARIPGRKKYAPPRTVTNCGRPLNRRSGPSACGIEKPSVGDAAGSGTRWPSNGSRLAGEPGKLASRSPTALCTNSNWRLMLATRQMKWMPVSPGGSAQARGLAAPYVASATKQAMEARGCDQILLQRRRVESQHAPQTREDAAHAGRQIRIARIGPPNVRAQRAAQALRIGLVGEGVQCRAAVEVPPATHRRSASRAVCRLAAAHHRRGQPLAQACDRPAACRSSSRQKPCTSWCNWRITR